MAATIWQMPQCGRATAVAQYIINDALNDKHLYALDFRTI